jgi:hypothetical protein
VKPKMLDLCCGRLGWGKVFAERGWDVVGVDLVRPSLVPKGCSFVLGDVLDWRPWDLKGFDFVCVSSPCDQFSCFTMKMWQPNPKYPDTGIELFNHCRFICEESGVPYVMENVRGAIQFVGQPVNRTGAYCLWGNGVPVLLPPGLTKSKWFKRPGKPGNICAEALKGKRERKAILATIPPELANCVADHAEQLIQEVA